MMSFFRRIVDTITYPLRALLYSPSKLFAPLRWLAKTRSRWPSPLRSAAEALRAPTVGSPVRCVVEKPLLPPQ